MNIHHRREIIELIVTIAEATFTTMVTSKAPERMDVKTIVHGTASKLVIPRADTSVGVVKARKGSTHKFLFVGVALEKKNRAVGKNEFVREFKVIRKAGRVLCLDDRSKDRGVINSVEVTGFDVGGQGIIIKEAERSRGGGRRSSGRARGSGSSKKLGCEISSMRVDARSHSGSEAGRKIGNGSLEVSRGNSTNGGSGRNSRANRGRKGSGRDAIPVEIVHRSRGEVKVEMRDLDDEGNRRDFSREGVAEIVGHVRSSETAIVKTAVGKVKGAGKTDADRRGHDGNANTGGIDGSTNGNRVNDFVDDDIAKKGHEVLVRADIGARSGIDEESGRIVNRGRVESVQLSGSVRKVGVVAEADAEVGNRREVSHGGRSEEARRQENWGSDSKAVKAQEQQQKL